MATSPKVALGIPFSTGKNVSGGSGDGALSSLKLRIRALGVLFILSIVLATGLAINLARHTEAARIGDAARQLAQAATRLRDRYYYVAKSFQQRDLADPLASSDDHLLRALTAVELAGMPRVEGGFYAAQHKLLLGYAYPTYQGSGAKTDIPPAERGSILAVASEAVASHRPSQKRVNTATDLILFRAVPIMRGSEAVGAVWVMHHMVGVRGAFEWFNALALGLLVIISAAATAGAWHLTRHLDTGISRIETALQTMEYRFDQQVPQTGITELDRISAAVGHLARTLDENQKLRTELELKLRHADRLAALGRLLAGVAHEVRNPLASIKLKTHLARAGAASQSRRVASALDVIAEETARIDRLVERLLALGRPPRPASEVINVARWLAEKSECLKPRATSQGTELRLSISPPDISVSTDRDRLNEILDNLVTNALEAVGSGGQILLEAEPAKSDREMILRVRDSGPGVPEPFRERLFEPFATTKRGGTGLGLFLAAELARTLGGELRFIGNSEGGRHADSSGAVPLSGACFEVRLPC